MGRYVIAYDLGTGGNKSSLYDVDGRCIVEDFHAYPTRYPRHGWHEQRPDDWWDAIIAGTRSLLAASGVDGHEIVSCGISGHSLGAVPIGRNGELLRGATPIWSDTRARDQADRFFERTSELDWYQRTGNGFPAHLYTVFKTMWYRDIEPEMFSQVAKVIGTKDYVNYRLTGRICTDPSYASGSGVFNLVDGDYDDEFTDAARLSTGLLPDIVPSTDVIGNLTHDAAELLGLPTSVLIVAGGVDNSCMALGARATRDGHIYNSQGSSSWIAASTSEPLIDTEVRPYVFAHVVPGLFTSAVSTFSSGTTFRWVRDQLCRDLQHAANQQDADVYELMTAEAATSPPGANGLICNPNMAGGTSLSSSVNIRGAFVGLDLRHTRADLIRAAMEGIAMELRVGLDRFRAMTEIGPEMLVVGGGSRSPLWRMILADVYDTTILKTNIDQQAAALGAAACAAVGAGLWADFDVINEIHHVESRITPDPDRSAMYNRILPIYRAAERHLSDLGDQIVRGHDHMTTTRRSTC
jgi:xylulokinase